ncbi:arylformamidase [Fictibacillus gelatini]|uniref:arylformamidase n=1 Tax=Fictibacillus gelatini TaxID=225985 RepID=UPI0004248515|nr:arylformamidase [Fictibacillus gelatini]
MKLYDISQPLRSSTPGWPGDTPYQYELTWTKEQSGSVNVGKIMMSTHLGTHIDAPFHFTNEGEKVIDLDPGLFVGKALIVDMTGKESIGASDMENIDLNGIPRLLFKTGSWCDRSTFPEAITPLRADLAPYLAEKGVRLIGVDVPSVDPLDSKELSAHHSLHKSGISILEGIILDHIDEGVYELIALPLPLEGADGSPVRAVLRSLDTSNNYLKKE